MKLTKEEKKAIIKEHGKLLGSFIIKDMEKRTLADIAYNDNTQF